MLIYTSGTTGRPKGAVHTHCGFPDQGRAGHAPRDGRAPGRRRLVDVRHGLDDGPVARLRHAPLRRDDGALRRRAGRRRDGVASIPGACGALCARHGVTLLGLSPSLVRALMPHGTAPVRAHDLSALRACGSTGSPWDPDALALALRARPRRAQADPQLLGRDRDLGRHRLRHVRRARSSRAASPAPSSGWTPTCVDEAGQPVRGAVGELVLRQPWIGMTRGFTRRRRRPAEARRATTRPTGRHAPASGPTATSRPSTTTASGSSSAAPTTRSRWPASGSVRPRSRPSLDADPRVAESAAVGVPDAVKGEALVRSSVLAPGADASEALRAELSGRVVGRARQGRSRPKAVYFVDALPRTRNAKVDAPRDPRRPPRRRPRQPDGARRARRRRGHPPRAVAGLCGRPKRAPPAAHEAQRRRAERSRVERAGYRTPSSGRSHCML